MSGVRERSASLPYLQSTSVYARRQGVRTQQGFLLPHVPYPPFVVAAPSSAHPHPCVRLAYFALFLVFFPPVVGNAALGGVRCSVSAPQGKRVIGHTLGSDVRDFDVADPSLPFLPQWIQDILEAGELLSALVDSDTTPEGEKTTHDEPLVLIFGKGEARVSLDVQS